MSSTRDQIRERLARGEATVSEIADALGMNHANIRRHLEVMRGEDLVDIRIQRHEVGRPAYVYRLSERALDQNAQYPRLVNRLVKRLAALPDAEPVLEQVFDGVADEIAGAYRPMVTGATVEERVAETSLALKEEGIVDHWRKDADGFHLMNTNCPYRKAAEVTDAPCHADHKVVQLLVGAPVEQVSRIVDGKHMCEYVVRDSGQGAQPDRRASGSF
ncbi:MAG TPA: ArsR family transcriptional regulator [Dehalococcoidia bacterium]|nr:ArsR family transcriptional regulator [Dehalococcoidia bacterium]